jgi:hypothetical protein
MSRSRHVTKSQDRATNARQSLSRGSGRERFQAVDSVVASEAFSTPQVAPLSEISLW